jgi:hypothetical protein
MRPAAVGQRRVGGQRRPRGWLAAAAVAVAVSSLLTGCSTLHQSLGTSDSPCYVALPTATAAAGHRGHFAGVRLLKVRSLHYAHLKTALHEAGVDSGQVCLVAFTGTFSASAVSHPSGLDSGRLAVVILRYPDGKLVATVLLHRLPTRFRHSHLG